MTIDNQVTANGSGSAETPDASPSASAGGAPMGNENALKSGVSAWLKSCRLPRCYRALRRRIREIGELLPAEVAQHREREPNTYEILAIERFIRAAGAMALLERWLAEEGANLGISDRLALLKQIDAAGDRMAKMLKELGFDFDPAKEFDWYGDYLRGGTPAAITSDQTADGATDASNGVLRDGEATP